MNIFDLECEIAFYKTASKLMADKLRKARTIINPVYQWCSDIEYEKNDKIIWHNIYFVCKKKHISGKSFNPKYWIHDN